LARQRNTRWNRRNGAVCVWGFNDHRHGNFLVRSAHSHRNYRIVLTIVSH
jgi:hypothetical protein